MITYRRALIFLSMGFMHLRYAQAMESSAYLVLDDEEDAVTRCVHGVPLAPSGVVCCTPKDGYFRNVTVLDTFTTGSIVINGGVICPCGSGSNGLNCSLAQTGTSCDAFMNNLFAMQNVSAGYYDVLDRYEVLSSNASIQDVFGNPALIQPFDLNPNNSFGAVAISARGTFVVFAATNNVATGNLYIYRRDVANNWNLFQEIASPSAGSDFGASLAISADGSIIAVGAQLQAPSGPNGQGAVYLYVRSGALGQYSLYQTILNPDPSGSDEFGFAVDLSATGAVLLIGDPAFNAGDGAAYTYIRAVSCSNCVGLTTTTTAWVLQQQILEPGVAPGSGDNFATSVKLSADGNFAAIGSPFGGGGAAGVAYVFQQSAGAWNPVATLNPSDFLGSYSFGNSVSISGDGRYVIVASPFQGAVGLAYIFYRSDIVWNQQAIIAPQSVNATLFGSTVAISNDGTKGAIGGFDTTPRGFVEVYDRFDTTWNYMQTVVGTVVQVTNDFFGSSLAISYDGSFLGVGAPLTDLTGAGYIFSPICSFVPTDLTVSGSVCIMNNAVVNGNFFTTGTLFYGGAAPAAAAVSPCGVCSSDKYLKEGVEPVDGAAALALLAKLRPVAFSWKRPDLHRELGDTPIGFISQEIKELFPHWVAEREPRATEKSFFNAGALEQMLAIKPDVFALLVASVQKLQHDYDVLYEKVQQLKNDVKK